MYRVSFVALMLITFVIATGTWYFIFYCRAPLVFNKPVVVHGTSFSPGEYLTYTLDYCKHTDAPFKVYRSWKDGYQYNSPVIRGAGIDNQVCAITKIQILVPKVPPSKAYRLYLSWEYKVGPFLSRTVRMSTKSFEITE